MSCCCDCVVSFAHLVQRTPCLCSTGQAAGCPPEYITSKNLMLFSDCLAQYAASTAQQFLYRLGRAPTITHVLRLPLVAHTTVVNTSSADAKPRAASATASPAATATTSTGAEMQGQAAPSSSTASAEATATSAPTGFRVWRTRGTDRRFVC